MNKRLFLLSSGLVIASLLLAACGNMGAALSEGAKGFSEGWNTPPNCVGSVTVEGETFNYNITPSTVLSLPFKTGEKRLLRLTCGTEGEIETPFIVESNAAVETALPVTPNTNGHSTLSTNWFVGNVPLKVVTIKPADPDSGMPTEVAHMFGPQGVLGADNLAEANANKSAVWTGSAVYHRAPDTAEFGFLGPEGSYSTIFAKQFGKVVLGDPKDPMFILSIPECGPHCAQGILIRSPFAEDGKDNHLPIWVEDYGAIGAASFTRYAVEPNWARVFSEGYWTDQAKNALVFDNNGIGNKDTNVFIGHVIDVNDGSYTVLKYTASEGWTVLWTNVVGHGK